MSKKLSRKAKRKQGISRCLNVIEDLDDSYWLKDRIGEWHLYVIGVFQNNLPKYAYVGITTNLERRLSEHKESKGDFTLLESINLGNMTYQEAEKYEDAYYILFRRNKVKVSGSHFGITPIKRATLGTMMAQGYFPKPEPNKNIQRWIKACKKLEKNRKECRKA